MTTSKHRSDGQIMSMAEARSILGADAEEMTDEEIREVILTLDLMANESLDLARVELRRKKDAVELANLIYDIYQDEKRAKNNSKRKT